MQKNKGYFKILKETPVKYVELEVSMDNGLEKTLLRYARDNIPARIMEEFLIQWAVIAMLLMEKGEGV